MNQAELAKACKVSVNTVGAWMLKGCPARRKDGHARFDLKDVQRWRRESLIPRPASTEGTASFSLARARKETALAELRELQLAREKGELVETELIRRGLDGAIVNQRTILLNISSQIGRDIDEPVLRARVVEIVGRRVREALEVLAAYDPIIQQHDDDDGDQDESPPQGVAPNAKAGKPKKNSGGGPTI